MVSPRFEGSTATYSPNLSIPNHAGHRGTTPAGDPTEAAPSGEARRRYLYGNPIFLASTPCERGRPKQHKGLPYQYMAVAVQIHFERAKTQPAEPQAEAITWFIGVLERNGSILRHSIIYGADFGWIVYSVAPARDAFKKSNQNPFVKQRLRELKHAKVKRPFFQFLGGVPETASDCKCAKTGALFLFTTFLHSEPPVWGMDCNGVVPLYRLPRSRTEEHSALLAWQSNYPACDSLQINCAVGERFGGRQMSDLASSLTVSGLTICKELEKQAGCPVQCTTTCFTQLHAAERQKRADAVRTVVGNGDLMPHSTGSLILSVTGAICYRISPGIFADQGSRWQSGGSCGRYTGLPEKWIPPRPTAAVLQYSHISFLTPGNFFEGVHGSHPDCWAEGLCALDLFGLQF